MKIFEKLKDKQLIRSIITYVGLCSFWFIVGLYFFPSDSEEKTIKPPLKNNVEEMQEKKLKKYKLDVTGLKKKLANREIQIRYLKKLIEIAPNKKIVKMLSNECDDIVMFPYLLSLISFESHFSNIISKTDDYGYFQINGQTLKWLYKKHTNRKKAVISTKNFLNNYDLQIKLTKLYLKEAIATSKVPLEVFRKYNCGLHVKGSQNCLSYSILTSNIYKDIVNE